MNEQSDFDYTGVAPEIAGLHKLITQVSANVEDIGKALNEQMALSTALSLAVSVILARDPNAAGSVRDLANSLSSPPDNPSFLAEVRRAFERHLHLKL